MDSIHVITAYNVFHDSADIFAASGYPRVEKQLFVVGYEPFGMFVVHVGFCQSGGARSSGTERIQPSVKLHVAAMALLDQESHGIEQGIGGNALFARAKTAPRFYFRQVPGIGFRADLENDGVDPTFLQLVEFTNKIGFHLFRCHVRVFALENGLNPCPAEFSLGGLLCR